MDSIDILLMEVHCNLIIRKGLLELEMEHMEEEMDKHWDEMMEEYERGDYDNG